MGNTVQDTVKTPIKNTSNIYIYMCVFANLFKLLSYADGVIVNNQSY